VLRLDPIPLEETLHGIIDLIRRLDAEVLIQVSLDHEGNVIDVECLASHVAPKNGIPLTILLERPLALRARCVIYFSSNPHGVVAEADVDFTRRLMVEAQRWDLGVVDHQLVGPADVISLRTQSDLWNV
jgi:DNA repair protein RadC